MTFRKEQKKKALFVERAILHVVKRIFFFCPFLMHLARQKVQMTFFSRKMMLTKGEKKCSSCSQKEQFFGPFVMHLARQKKVQMTFFSRNMMLRKEQKKNLFVKRAILHVVKRNNFFFLFWCIWQGKKYKWRSFIQRWPSERNKKKVLFVVRAILHVVKRNNVVVLFWCIWQGKKYKWRSFLERWHSERKNKCSFCEESRSSCSQKEFFFVLFWCIWQGKKVQITFFSRKMMFRKNKKKCSFSGESNSSCSQKEHFFCPFLMHLARQKVQMTLFSRKMTFRKEQKKNVLFVVRAILHVVKRNNFVVLFWCIWQGKKYKWRSFLERWHSERNKKKCSFCGESHSSCSQKEHFFLSFSDAFGKAKSTFSRKLMLRKEQKNALFVKRAILHVVKRNNFFFLFWCIWQGKKYKWRSFLQRWPSERNKKNVLFVVRAILHVVKRNNFFCPFLMHLARLT